MSTVRMSILTVALAALTLCVFASQSVAQTYTCLLYTSDAADE